MIDVDITGQLIPNLLTVLVQLCSTLVLFLLAKKFLWKSVKNWLDARADKMQSDLETSEKAKQDALSDRENAKTQLNEAAKKSEEIVEAAVKEADSEKQAILDKARAEAEEENAKAREAIENDRLKMVDSVKKEMVNVAMDAAEKLIGSKNGEELDRKAIQDFVKEADSHEE